MHTTVTMALFQREPGVEKDMDKKENLCTVVLL